MVIVLKILKPSIPKYIALKEGKYVIGREEGADIILDNNTVSRKHCILKWKDAWFIKDIDSKNGVYLNGNRIKKTEKIEDGDNIKIGRIPILIEMFNKDDYLPEQICSSPVNIKFEEDETDRLIIRERTSDVENRIMNLTKTMHSLLETDFERELRNILSKRGIEDIGAIRFEKSRLTFLTVLSSFNPEEIYKEKNPKENFDLHLPDSFFYNRYLEKVDGGYYIISKSIIEERILSLLDMVFRYFFLLHQEYRKIIHKKKEFIPKEYVFESPITREILDYIGEIAGKDGNVLIEGETGVGKEVIANLLHKLSPRANAPFITLVSTAIPETLAESELFGVREKSVTGVEGKEGKFEAANHGSLFFDEIGDMPLSIQGKLLRAIELGEILKIGSTKPIKVDVRIIAATNRNLEEGIKEGWFRKDLYFRLSSFKVHIPPLRKRSEEIIPLAYKFAEEYSKRFSKPFRGITEKAKKFLLDYEWPGNIRELKDEMRRTMAKIGEDGVLSAKLLSKQINQGILKKANSPSDMGLKSVEKETIIKALEKTGWNKTKASALLGISRVGLIKKIKRLEIEKEDKK